jgi:hypothetical protein
MDYDGGWWSGLLGEPLPAIRAAMPNVARGYADGVSFRSSWIGQNVARRLACQLQGEPIRASGPALRP